MKLNYTILGLLLVAAGASSAQYRFAGKVLGFSREYNSYPESWCAAQALGDPNVYPQYGDIDGAWVGEDYGDQRDTIILGFDNNSPIDSILIWETCGAGIVDSVYIKNPQTNKWVLVFGRKGQNYPDAADTMARILRIGFPVTGFNVNEVRIETANDSSDEWVEIDAVAIHPKTLTPTTYSNNAGNAASFDGIDDYYRTNVSGWDVTHNDEFTVMMWAKVKADTAFDCSYAYQGPALFMDNEYNTFGFTLSNIGKGDSIYAFVSDDNFGQVGLPVNKDVWQHITMVNTKAKLKVYLNGVFYATVEGSEFDSSDNFGLIEFGRNYSYERNFKGEIDEVKCFNRALTDAEILKQKYSIGAGAVNANLVGYWQFNQTDSFFLNTYTHRTDSLHNGGTFIPTGTLLSVRRTQPVELGIYPNPNQGNFTISLQNQITGNVEVTIMDIHGRNVFAGGVQMENGKSTFELGSLPSGVYVLNVGAESIRFIKE